MGRGLLHAAEVVGDLVQDDRRLPVPGVGVGAGRRQHHPGEAAAVGEVVGRGAAVGRDLRDAPDALVLGGGLRVGRGEPVGEDEHVARAVADRGVHVAGDRIEVVVVVAGDVRAARPRKRDRLDVEVLRPALVAHVEAQRPAAAGLQGEELLDARYVGLQRVLPLVEVVALVAGVGVDDLDLALGGRERGVDGVVGRALRAAPRGRQVLRQVRGDGPRQVRHGQRVVDVRGGQVRRPVAVVGLRPVVGPRRGRQGQEEEHGDGGWSCEAHDP